jgi:putative flippase GtrA
MLGALGANVVAMAIATLFNTAVHRELSHGRDGLLRRGRMILVVLSLYAISLALTTGALLIASVMTSGSLVAELIAITVANAVAAIFRFSVLRAWVFRPRTFPDPAHTLEVSR